MLEMGSGRGRGLVAVELIDWSVKMCGVVNTTIFTNFLCGQRI